MIFVVGTEAAKRFAAGAPDLHPLTLRLVYVGHEAARKVETGILVSVHCTADQLYRYISRRFNVPQALTFEICYTKNAGDKMLLLGRNPAPLDALGIPLEAYSWHVLPDSRSRTDRMPAIPEEAMEEEKEGNPRNQPGREDRQVQATGPNNNQQRYFPDYTGGLSEEEQMQLMIQESLGDAYKFPEVATDFEPAAGMRFIHKRE